MGIPSPVDVAERHAPLVLVDRGEKLWPIAAEAFIGECALGFGLSGATSGLAAPVDSARIGSASSRPYRYDARSLGGGFAALSAADHTRPYDVRSPEFAALPQNAGFVLSLRDAQQVRGSVPPTPYGGTYSNGVPVYFAYRPGRSISFWFCYAGSGLPAALSHHLSLRAGGRHFDGGQAVAVESVAAGDVSTEDAAAAAVVGADEETVRVAFAEAYPQLYSLVAGESLVAADRVETLSFMDIWDKLLTFVTVISGDDGDTYLCHEGDWEHVTVNLNAANEMADPVSVDFNMHGNAHPVDWSKLSLDPATGRFRVFSGRGSHASLPYPGLNGADYGDADGVRWETWNQVEPIDQPWWGFGGAWGRIGEVSDLTGPLGPSPYKPDSSPGGQQP